ncbi:MAG: Serine/threonine protein kinase [Blastococcus sp.]|nr:Serine/threonine protein kinase [Blastococcus sp.]
MPPVEPPAPAGTAPPGVPGYVLETLLGRGGSGEVWRAVPRRGGEPVAVKVLVAGEPERQAREAALLGALDHPHLVRLIEVVHQPRRDGATRVALVLELLAGGSLAALLARRGRLRPGEVVTAIAPVAAALAHAHTNGVVHGDLSPGNIVFTEEGRPVLTDLGVARVLGEIAAGEVTPAYVDPTVARGGAPGPASDVFGIAAAAFHALTGIAPWNAATAGDTLTVAASGELPDLAELAPEAPPELIEVISRGLAADPHDRGSAAAFALDLRHACRPEPVRLPSSGVPDAELANSGRNPRTELTHQVPGRRPRPAPVIVEPPGRRESWRTAVASCSGAADGPLLRRAAIVLLVLGALACAGWAGSWSAGAPGGGGERAAEVAASSPLSGQPEADRTTPPDVVADPTAATAEPVEPVEPAPADRSEAPDSAEGWRAVVADLYQRRAHAFAAARADGFAGVYAPGSAQRTADEQYVRALGGAGEALRGFAPEIADVSVSSSDGTRVHLDLVDRWPDYDVVSAGAPDGPAVRSVPGRPGIVVRLVLVRTGEGWRIESGRRLA